MAPAADERPGPPRRAGRPRRDGRTTSDPTDDILAAAARLFGELGVEATTMSRLAKEAGLGQSSLYYWFSSREEVLATLAARANVVPLALVEKVLACDSPPSRQLHDFVRGDVEALCALPFDINELHRVAARDRNRFATYWTERERLEQRLAELIAAGVAAGAFRAVDPRTAARMVMGTDEGVQNWFRLGVDQSPAEIAAVVADFAVAGLTADHFDAASK